jgi:cell wall-associated NlpC family hydrolase
LKALIEYARRFIGVPYYYGGEHPSRGFDCSGFIQEVLQYVGIDPVGDQSAQALYNHFLTNSVGSFPGTGALVFYGEDVDKITHVALMTSNFTVIEAAGGSPEMIGPKALELAVEKKAFVKERPLTRRKDIVAIILPHYPVWIVNEL